MPTNPKTRRPAGRPGATPRESAAGLPLPHERDESIDEPTDESTDAAAQVPDPVMAQAKRDIDAGLVDTDLRASPGLNAKRRARLVPGPGGKPPSSRS